MFDPRRDQVRDEAAPARRDGRSSPAALSAQADLGFTRLASVAAGPFCFIAYLAGQSSGGLTDAVLGLSLFAFGPALADALDPASGAMPRRVLTVVRAGLVAVILSALGQAGWPVLLWLVVEPVQALRAGRKLDAGIAAAAGVAGIALAAIMAASSPIAGGSTMAAELAGAFLSAGTLIEALRASDSARRVQKAPPAGSRHLVYPAWDVVTWHDRRGSVIEAGSATSRLAGTPVSDLRSAGLFERVHLPDRPAYLLALSEAAGGVPRTARIRLRPAQDPSSGRSVPLPLVPVEMRVQPVDPTSDGGAPAGAVAVAFTRPVDEPVSGFVQPDRTDEMTTRFLATVSHELRTPLNAIIGFSELLSGPPPFMLAEERRQEYATIIHDSGQHLLDVVNTLLDMSKLDSGTFAVAAEPFGIGALVQSCCDLMQLRFRGAGVTLHAAIPPDLPEFVGDRRACRQIVINLLSNAVKFTRSGGRVEVAIRRTGRHVVLSVADDGVGIGAADLPRLGDPFFQAGDLLSRRHEGTGLGLSVVRGLVALHRGTVLIESGTDLGTTVSVSLPLDGNGGEVAQPLALRTAVREPAPRLDRKSA